MSISNYKPIRRIKDFSLANVMLNLLKSEDIPAVLLSKKDSMYYMPSWGYYEILVPQDELQRSEVLLSQFENTDSNGTG